MTLPATVSLTSAASVVPFSDLANFISNCNPSPIHYALTLGEPYTSLSQSSENWYIVVPTRVKNVPRPTTTLISPLPTHTHDMVETPRIIVTPSSRYLHNTLVELASKLYHCANLTQATLVTASSAFVHYAYQAAYGGVLFCVLLSLRFAQLAFSSLGNIAAVMYFIMYWISRPVYLAPMFIYRLALDSTLYVFSTSYRLLAHIFNLAIVQLYFIPMSYITMMAAALGSMVGLVAGLAIVTIQYVLPSAVVKNDPPAVTARAMVKEFTARQAPKKKQLLSPLKLTSLPAPKKQVKQLVLPENIKPPVSFIDLNPSFEEMPKPEFVTPNDGLSSVESVESSFSGKHGSYTSEYDEEPDQVIRRKSIADKFTDRALSLQLSPSHSPLYEDEDGYSNYVQKSLAQDIFSADNSASNTAATSPIAPLLSSDRRFKLTRHRRRSLSPPTDPLAVGRLFSNESEQSSVYEEAIEAIAEGEFDDAKSYLPMGIGTGIETRSVPVQRRISSFEAIAEEADEP